MNRNPYEAPPGEGMPMGEDPGRRTAFILAGIGAAFASLYWAGLTALLAFGVSAGRISGTQLILPCVLIGLYAVRSFQIFKGDPTAAKKVLWLHGVGGALALFQMFSGTPVLMVFQGIKVVIHLFGGVTAYLAQRQT